MLYSLEGILTVNGPDVFTELFFNLFKIVHVCKLKKIILYTNN